ncbi:MAG: hypothetical protein IKB70_06070 [Bacilli bacterium]|nr:hypothetical protein [Bacilli bacterium]
MSDVDKKFKEIDKLMEKNNKNNKFNLDNASIEPIHPSFLWSANGIWAYIAVMGSGKSYSVMKTILQQESLSDEPYYELVVYCSTSNGFDQTVQTHQSSVKKSKLVFVQDTQLLDWVNKYIRRILKYNAINTLIFSEFKKFTDEMLRLKDKHRLTSNNKLIKYIATKLVSYGWKTYPHRCLLILDDFASHPLVRTKESEMSRLLKKLRHFNITVNIIVQTTASLSKEIRRILSDVVLFRGVNEDDFKAFFKVVPNTYDVKKLWNLYKSMKNRRDKMILHLSANKIVVDRYQDKIEIYDDF